MPMRAAVRQELQVSEGYRADMRSGPVVIPIELRKLPGRPINLDNCFIAVDNLPFGVRLTAGVTNEASTWLLTPRQMEEVALVVAEGHHEPFPLSLRIVMLDPDGYDFAATVARFDVLVQVQPGPRGVVPPLELDFRRFCGGGTGWFEARFGSSDKVPTLRLVDKEEELILPPRSGDGGGEDGNAPLGVLEQMVLAARAEWEADEAARFARAREQWQEAEEQRRAIQNLEADDRLSRLLAEAELRWRAAEEERVAAHDIRWQSKMAQVFSVLSKHKIEIPAELLDAQTPPKPPAAAQTPKNARRVRDCDMAPSDWRIAAALFLAACVTVLFTF
jgi:hypothetical protein